MGNEELSGQVRRALAATLAGVARGLSASARMVEQASWILRPREPAAAEGERGSETVGGPGAGVETAEPAGATGSADVTEPNATDVMEPGGGGIVAMDAPAEAEDVAPAGAAEAEDVAPPAAAEAEDVAPAGAGEAADVAPEEPAVTEGEPAAEPPPTAPAPEGPDHVRVAESHIAALADRPVAGVVSEIAGLSTDELEDLYAYEVTHKNRKTVLRAIERAVAPSSSSS